MQADKYYEEVAHNGKILALIIRTKSLKNFEDLGKKMSFITPDYFPFQMAIQKRDKEEIVEPHFHIPFKELKNFSVQEFLYIISGKAKVFLYNDDEEIVDEIIIEDGDGVILNTGHSIKFLKDVKLLILKQGPYRGHDAEKRFI